MDTPIILNLVIVSTKQFLHVYHCQQNIVVKFNVHQGFIFGAQTAFMYYFKWVLKKIVGFGVKPKGALVVLGQTQRGY